MGQDVGLKLEKFWALVVQVWRTGLLGIDIGHILGAAGIFILFIVLRRIVSAFIMARLEAWTRRTKTDIDNRFVEILEPPVQFIPIVLGAFFAVDFLNLTDTYALLGNNIVRSLIVFTIFWAFHRVISPLSDSLKHLEKLFTAAMLEWLVKAIKATVIFIGAATILQIWGIEVGPLIAGLGLFGVAVALGAQDLFKNLIAGLLVIAEKRFNQGDWILVEGTVEGVVESIGFRSTLVRRFDKAPVYVPNSKLSDTAVVNFSKMTHRRIYWKIGVVYSTTVDQLRRIRDGIEAYILGSDDFAKPPEVAMFVRIDQFNDSSIDIMLYCFTKTTVWGEWLAIKEQLAYHVKSVVEEAGSSFAFPSRSLYIETPGSDQAEAFLPPDDTADDPSGHAVAPPSLSAKGPSSSVLTADPQKYKDKASMMTTIYHNPRCSKSRQTLALIEEKGISPQIIEYLQNPPDSAALKEILAKLGKTPKDLVRTKEAREEGLDIAALDDDGVIAAMVAHPRIIERPIVVRGDKAALGRPPESILDIL